SFKSIDGSLKGALTDPLSIVITRSRAEKLFKGKAIGKSLYLNNNKSKSYTVTAVIDDIPSNSSFYGFDFFMTLSGHEPYPGEKTNWLASNYSTYFKVKEGSDVADLEAKLSDAYINNYYKPAVMQAGIALNEEVWNTAKMTLQPLEKIHLYS